VTYEELGQASTHEKRVLAAEASIAFMFGTYLDTKPLSGYVHPAVARLEEFAGEEAWLEAAHRARIMEIGDEPDRGLVEAGILALREAFDFADTPQGKRGWTNVIARVREASRRAGVG